MSSRSSGNVLGVTGAETAYSKATKLELEGQFDKAFQLYIKAAEEHLHLSRSTGNAVTRDRHKAEAAKALERAEKIKGRKRDIITPVVVNYFAEHEQNLILQNSSTVNGIRYPLWVGPHASGFIDLTQPELSSEQLAHGALWSRRPAEECVVCNSTSNLLAQDIVQHVVSDCSLCASIAVCVEHDRRFGSKLIKSALYPQDANRLPTISPTGQYYARMLVNGGHRRANIDNQLPVYPDGKLMCMSTGSKRELWPSLTEKLYMKLMGGYDFPGSTSQTDLYTFTGWIPERIEISSPHFEREKTWRRISSAYSEGRCLLTLGTGHNVSDDTALPWKLLVAHCYAVVDLGEVNEIRQMRVLDNWVDPPEHDLDADLDKLTLREGIASTSDITERPTVCAYDLAWDTVCSVFDSVCLNWNPAMFDNYLQFHGAWKNDAADHTSIPRQFTVHLSVDSRTEQDVWVLLSRHVTDSRRSGEFISLSVDDESLEVRHDLMLKGEYTNDLNVLVRTQCRTSVLAVTASYDGGYDNVGFSISAYSSAPIVLVPNLRTFPFVQRINGALTSKNAGGNPALPTFMINPQYHLRVHAISAGRPHLTLALSGDRRVPLHVLVVWSQGQRITDLAGNDIALSSGAYNYGYATAMKSLPAGDYTVIVSAYETRHTCPFTLKVECSSRIELNAIPQEGSMMFSTVVRGAWTEDTAGGSPAHNKYTSNPVYELKLPTQSQILIRLQLPTPDNNVKLNVTLFRVTTRRTLGAHIATSGPYSDAISGVVTPQINLQAGSYYIIPSTYSPGKRAQFKILVYGSVNGISVEETVLP